MAGFFDDALKEEARRRLETKKPAQDEDADGDGSAVPAALGGIVGAIAGGLLGGPMGALQGATAGAGLGGSLAKPTDPSKLKRGAEGVETFVTLFKNKDKGGGAKIEDTFVTD